MSRVFFEKFDPVKGFAPIINEGFKLDPAGGGLGLPGLLPQIPKMPSIEPPIEIPDWWGDDDGDGIPNVWDTDHPLYRPPIIPEIDPNDPVFDPEDVPKPVKPEPIFDPTRVVPWPDWVPDDWPIGPFFQPLKIPVG